MRSNSNRCEIELTSASNTSLKSGEDVTTRLISASNASSRAWRSTRSNRSAFVSTPAIWSAQRWASSTCRGVYCEIFREMKDRTPRVSESITMGTLIDDRYPASMNVLRVGKRFSSSSGLTTSITWVSPESKTNSATLPFSSRIIPGSH